MDLSTLINGTVVVVFAVLVLYAIQARRSASQFATDLIRTSETATEQLSTDDGRLSGWSQSTLSGPRASRLKIERRDAETRILGIVGRRGRLHLMRCTPCTVEGRELTEVVPVSEDGKPLGDPEYREESMSESIERLL